MEEESSTSAGHPASAAAPLTSYDKVYCGEVEGRLEVTDQGIFFRPTDATVTPNPATPYEILWRDTTHRDFVQEVVQASVSSYATEVSVFRLKLGVLPSKEVTFSMPNKDEWERLQSELDARGYGPPGEETHDDADAEDAHTDVDEGHAADEAHGAPDAAAPDEAHTAAAANDHAGVDVDDFDDNAETVYNDYNNERAPEESQEFTTEGYNEQSFTEGAEVPDHSFDHDMSDMSHTYFTQENQAEDVNWESEQRDDNIEEGDEEGEEYDGDEYSNVGAGEDESSIPNSSYYPVFHHGSVGSLVLTNSHLQFIPDRHSEPVKTLPWTSLADDPVFSPSTYPQAVMTVRYHTTRGPHKKAGFDLDGNHEELQYLQEEIYERMRPWRDAPRERVHVPTKAKTKNAGLPEGFKLHQKSPLFPLDDSRSYSQTDDDMSAFSGTNTNASAVPLVERRRVPFHKKEETPRRMLMLFCSYCCLVSVTILATMVIVGYFFGPRKPKDQYVRTQSPYSIQADYLGTEPPTPVPTFESWNSGTALMSRAPGSTIMPASEEGEPNNGRASAFDPFANNSTFVNYTENTGDLPQRGADFDIGSIMAANGTSFNVSSPEPTVTPATPAPTIAHTRSDETVLNLLLDNAPDGGESIRTTGTPQQAAYLLVRISDVEEEATSDAMIAQKFALATFYYATDGDEWKDGADDWVDLASSDCDKPHLDCAEFTGMVTGIDMPSNNMNGSIPPEIGMMKYLTHLNLKNNDLHGSLPTELGLLTNLQTLDVSGNPRLQGSIPEEVRALPSLKEITAALP